MLMKEDQTNGPGSTSDGKPSAISGANRRTLDAIFRHPAAHNVDWDDVVKLMGCIGTIEHKASDKLAFLVGHERHTMHKPHTKQLTAPEIVDLRHFIAKAGWSPEASSQPPARPDPVAPALMVVVDHHEAKIYRIDVASENPARHVIEPYDPLHYLHHLTHKDQTREHGQRAPEDATFYERISQAVALGGRIVVIGNGKGHSSAAYHLAEYLRDHHPETYQRIVHETVADLSSLTDRQLLQLGRHVLYPAP